MKNGEIIKNVSSKLSDEDLSLINKYTRREMTADELYTFSVVLCDNEIDRDFERFSISALYDLAKLYEGKTGVFDHNPSAENQIARIYKCDVERMDEKTTAAGETYHRLVAKAYLPVTDGNRELILMLDSGIRKEVSVGCSIGESFCSICGVNKRSGKCTHKKGKMYDGVLCHTVLNKPSDAYEWSFVAVPAQRNAGVIKNYYTAYGEVKSMTEILKSLSSGEDVTLSAQDAAELYTYINSIKQNAEIGKAYKDEMKREIVKLSALIFPEIGGDVMAKLADSMDFEALKAFKAAYSGNIKGTKLGVPTLAPKEAYSADKPADITASAANNSYLL